MTRNEVTELVLDAKQRKGLSFSQIASELGADKVWLTAALLGQHPLTNEQARGVQKLLDLPKEVIRVFQRVPTRGSLDRIPPSDPTIYRIYEVLQVYGTTIKALIHEEFGDGIMSAISFNLAVDREEADEGPRVKITLNGKFLPYTW